MLLVLKNRGERGRLEHLTLVDYFDMKKRRYGVTKESILKIQISIFIDSNKELNSAGLVIQN